jgi:hypothetical protein
VRRAITLAVLLACGCADQPPPLPPGPGAKPSPPAASPSAPPSVPQLFRLTLTREQDGDWAFLRCTLDVDVMDGPAPVTLTCQKRDGARLRARGEMSAGEVQELREILDRADIYAPPHTGVNRGLVHWRFETVTLRPIEGEEHAVVLVASGNESFKAGARGRLLYTLWRLQRELETRVQ